MKFFTAAALATIISSISAFTTATDQTLADWWQTTPFTIFPNHTGWEASFDSTFSTDVKATFNFVTHDFASLKKFFTGVYGVVSTNYEYLRIEPVDAVVLGNAGDNGGLVYMTGRESGLLKAAGSQERTERDAVFAIVKEINGTRKFVEWRETTNFF